MLFPEIGLPSWKVATPLHWTVLARISDYTPEGFQDSVESCGWRFVSSPQSPKKSLQLVNGN